MMELILPGGKGAIQFYDGFRPEPDYPLHRSLGSHKHDDPAISGCCGEVQFIRTGKLEAVVHCKGCGLRITVPADTKTYKDLEKALALKAIPS